MSPTSKREYIHAVRQRYAHASKRAKGQILDEFCATLGYHRKAAIRVLAGPAPAPGPAAAPPAPMGIRPWACSRRLLASGQGDPVSLRALQELRQRLDPFALAEAIERKLARIYRLASRPPRSQFTSIERAVLRNVTRSQGVPITMAGASAKLTPLFASVTPSMAR